jgi:hypothetical protein
MAAVLLRFRENGQEINAVHDRDGRDVAGDIHEVQQRRLTPPRITSSTAGAGPLLFAQEKLLSWPETAHSRLRGAVALKPRRQHGNPFERRLTLSSKGDFHWPP